MVKHQTTTKTRQEEAYEFVSQTFMKLLVNDKRIGVELKQIVITCWQELFDHEGVRSNMLLAFSNFLEEIDKRMDAARKAGIVQAQDALVQAASAGLWPDLSEAQIKTLIATLLEAESEPEETLTDIENTDLSEVGGGNESNVPLL